MVKGASNGEGLGNKFLAHIREVDAIAHVVRCFEDDNITHVSSKIDPIDDIETISMELNLADLETLQNKISALQKKSKNGDKETQIYIELISKLQLKLNNNEKINSLDLTDDESLFFFFFNLINAKPMK